MQFNTLITALFIQAALVFAGHKNTVVDYGIGMDGQINGNSIIADQHR